MNARTLRACASALAILVLTTFAAGCGSDANTIQQSQPIGTACTASSQCGTTPFFCDKAHPNGYCKRDCKSDAECPAEAICAFDGATGACHKKCNTIDDCRKGEGYICKPLSTDKDTLASHAYCDVDDATSDDGGITDGGGGDGKAGG